MSNLSDAAVDQVLANARQARAEHVGALVKRAFATIWAPVRAWRSRSTMAAELYGMTERELADIGLARTDIPAVLADTFQDETRDRGIRRSAEVHTLPVKAKTTDDGRLAA